MLLDKAKAPRLIDKAALFVDKRRDSGEVVKLVERLRDAITRYQVSEDWFVVTNALSTPRDRFHNSKRSTTKSQTLP